MPSPSASATASGPARASGVVPARLSAQRLHELAVEAFRIGNRGRLSLCESLRVLSETRLFSTCHALIHVGLLRVTSDAPGEVRWSPIGAGDALDRAVAADRAVADELPVLHFEAERRSAAATPGGSGESAAADSPPPAAGCGPDLEALAQGLVLARCPCLTGQAAHRSRRSASA